MPKTISLPRSLRGEITPPGDKSISHRAALLNSIAQGKARVTNFSPAVDCISTLTCLRALGVTIEQVSSVSGAIDIDGVGEEGLKEASDVLYAGNSGTTMRLLSGLLASQPFLSVVTGDDSLRSRPMERVVLPLRTMGANVWGRGNGSLAPLAIMGGKLHGIEYALPVPSAQVKSAILLAGLFADGETTIQEPSKSRDHTERLFQSMGVKLTVDDLRISLVPPDTVLDSLDIHVPGDISSAAYWLVGGAVHPNAQLRIRDVGINPTRSGVVDVLLRMGAKLRIENKRNAGGEPLADLLIESSDLIGVEIAGELVPRLIDEIPVIAVAACLAKGDTVIRDAEELRVKETDRIGNLVSELHVLGARIEEMSDGMIIHGGATLRGATCSSHYDHRMAMALGIAGLVADGETVIEDADVVEVSYPTFWRDLGGITA
ncbi:3-phosphoshikimate 1-carboxyvinyltransferase [Chloroflexota bacterium]